MLYIEAGGRRGLICVNRWKRSNKCVVLVRCKQSITHRSADGSSLTLFTRTRRLGQGTLWTQRKRTQTGPWGANDRRNMPRESAGWIYSPLRLSGPSAERQKQQFRQQELPPTARLSKFKQLNVFVTCPELPVVTRPAGRRFSSSFLFNFFKMLHSSSVWPQSKFGKKKKIWALECRTRIRWKAAEARLNAVDMQMACERRLLVGSLPMNPWHASRT